MMEFSDQDKASLVMASFCKLLKFLSKYIIVHDVSINCKSAD